MKSAAGLKMLKEEVMHVEDVWEEGLSRRRLKEAMRMRCGGSRRRGGVGVTRIQVAGRVMRLAI